MRSSSDNRHPVVSNISLRITPPNGRNTLPIDPNDTGTDIRPAI